MKNTFLLLFLFAIITSTFGQSYQKYDWDNDRSPYDVNDSTHNEIWLLHHEQYEYQYENNNLVMYHTLHDIVKVNNDNAVSSNNRIYIPIGGTTELLEVKARTFSPSGEVQLLDQSEIKEIQDEEEGSGYRIFAIEGAKVGGEIEYTYTRKMLTDYFGVEYFQFSSPLKKASFKLISPSNLRFTFKSYNGFPSVERDTSMHEMNVYSAEASDISALKNEPYSIYNDYRQKVAFKLNFNTAKGRIKLFTWEKVGKTIYERLHNLDKKEEKAVDKILKAIDVKNKSEYLKAAAIEDYVKRNFYLEENAGYQTQNISFIYDNKFTNKFGLTRLLVNLYEAAGLNIQLVLTSDRSNFKLDPEFESYNYLTDYLIYLTDIDKYVAPYLPEHRINLIPPQFTANAALFTKSVELMGETFPVSEIGEIPAEEAKKNYDNMDVKVSFNETLTHNKIILNRSFKGYQASYIKAIFPVIPEDNRKELKKDLVKFMSQDADIDEMTFKNTDFNYNNWDEPIELYSKFSSKSFIENAGPTVLFKLGALIGPQSELYQEEDRKLPVANEYNRSYYRKIEVNIPEGYTIQNPDDIKINKVVKNADDKPVYLFQSNYELTGNKLIVNVDEYYDQVYFPKEKFEDFRSVINAAADFNKIVLVLKKS